MDNDLDNKIGGGIATVSTILLLVYFLSIVCYSFILLKHSVLINEFKEHNIAIPSYSFMKFSIVLSIIGILSIILILTKKRAGIYLYFTCVIINTILNIAYKGFSANILTTLALPAFMAFFISRKRKLFFISTSSTLNIKK